MLVAIAAASHRGQIPEVSRSKCIAAAYQVMVEVFANVFLSPSSPAGVTFRSVKVLASAKWTYVIFGSVKNYLVMTVTNSEVCKKPKHESE
jgi:hypothetical protein